MSTIPDFAPLHSIKSNRVIAIKSMPCLAVGWTCYWLKRSSTLSTPRPHYSRLQKHFEKSGRSIPLIVSGTITDRSGRTLSGQTLEAFLASIAHANPLMVGLNCALGPEEMDSFIEELARVAPIFVSAYPYAGLPDPLSETGFPETPDTFAPKVLQWARNGWLNMVGGCCGTTPAHIAAFAKQARELP